MQDPDLRPSRRAVCAALIQCCRSTNCHEMRRPRSSAPLAGRARRRRSGSTSVRDNLAHLVDDETQHDHARYDGARWHRPSRQQHGLAPSRSGAASLRGYRSVCGSCVRFLSLAVLQPVSPGFDVPEAARRSSAAIHSPSEQSAPYATDQHQHEPSDFDPINGAVAGAVTFRPAAPERREDA
jgi:hypothetical protein